MSDDISFLEWAFKGCVGIIFTVGGWLWAKLMSAVAKNRDEISKLQLHVSENYAKKTDLNPIFDALKSIQLDVKILLGRKVHDERDDI